MRMLLTLTTATLLAAPVLASPQATLNECWGDVLSQFAQTQPGAVGVQRSGQGVDVPADPATIRRYRRRIDQHARFADGHGAQTTVAVHPG